MMLWTKSSVSTMAVASAVVFAATTTTGCVAFMTSSSFSSSSSVSPTAFVSSRGSCGSSSSSSSSPTSLYISSWGTQGPPSRWSDTLERENPKDRIQAYLKEPEPVEVRNDIDGTCLVSGLVNDKDRTDQFLYDLLNHEESAFEYDKIVAFVDDVKFSKKRLLSRSARYTGLLDKLDFMEASSVGSLPSVDQLEGVKTWLAYVPRDAASDPDGSAQLDVVKQVAAIAKNSKSVANVAVLLTGANEVDPSACQAAIDALAGKDDLTYTVIAVGTMDDDTPEGKVPYQYQTFGTELGVIPETATFSREESYRVVTELLQLECGSNLALSFGEVYNVNKTEYKLVKGLREAGYDRLQEMDHMVRKGPEEYQKAIDEWETKNPDAAKGYTSDAWWEAEIYQKSRRRSAEREKEKEQTIKDERTKEVEAIAKEWAKREYFRQSMAGMIDKSVIQTEEQFIESVWDRAVFEGDIKYRQMKGESVDNDAELATFKLKQERKQQAMLKRAKEELAEVLGEDVESLDKGPDDAKKD